MFDASAVFGSVGTIVVIVPVDGDKDLRSQSRKDNKGKHAVRSITDVDILKTERRLN